MVAYTLCVRAVAPQEILPLGVRKLAAACPAQGGDGPSYNGHKAGKAMGLRVVRTVGSVKTFPNRAAARRFIFAAC
jgi:hypothetical protein